MQEDGSRRQSARKPVPGPNFVFRLHRFNTWGERITMPPGFTALQSDVKPDPDTQPVYIPSSGLRPPSPPSNPLDGSGSNSIQLPASLRLTLSLPKVPIAPESDPALGVTRRQLLQLCIGLVTDMGQQESAWPFANVRLVWLHAV
jgi:hypothetical protein